MQFPCALTLTLALLGRASGHYMFGRLIFNGQWSDTFEYVREITPEAYEYDPEIALLYPNTEPKSEDMRCGRNASVAWSPVKTATVQAGDTVGFGVGVTELEKGIGMYHPGFASAWLSKSPTDDLDSYTGDGDWFKILMVTDRTEQSLDYSDPENEVAWDPYKSPWGTFRLTSYNFTIPETTPPGHYLLRFEHVFPNEVDAQFYMNCAHVEIVNSGGDVGTPGPLVKIPGVYERGQPDVYFAYYADGVNATTFVPPKPDVWSG